MKLIVLILVFRKTMLNKFEYIDVARFLLIFIFTRIVLSLISNPLFLSFGSMINSPTSILLSIIMSIVGAILLALFFIKFVRKDDDENAYLEIDI